MTQSALELAQSIASTSANMTQFTLELAQSIAPTAANMTQSTVELAQSIAPTSGNMTQSTSKLAQSAKDANDDDLKPESNPAAITDTELSHSTIASSLAQSDTLDPINIAQSEFGQARIAYAISNKLTLTTQVRNTYLPSFIVNYLCI
jgi:hypothetical protein